MTGPDPGRPGRQIVTLAVPMLVGALSSALAGAVDIGMMGHYAEPDLAAVAAGAALFDIFGGVVLASVTGHQILAARFAGRDDMGGIRRSLRSSAVFCGAIAAALTAACLAAGGPLAALLVGGDRRLTPIAAQYLAARAPTLLLLVGFALLAAGFNAYRRPRYPMVAGLVVAGTNVTLDWLLIYGPGPAPRLGAAGNGLATTLSWAVGVAFLLMAVRRSGLMSMLRGPAEAGPADFVTSVPRLSWPAIVSTGLDYLGVAVFFAVIGGLGAVELGGGRIAFEVMILIFGVASTFAAAGRILIGRALGAGRTHDVRRFWRAGQLTLVLPAAALGLGMAVFPAAVARVFTAIPSVVEAAGPALLLVALSLPALAWALGNVSLLRALGHTDRDMYANLVAALGVQLPLAWVLAGPAGLGLTGAFLGVAGYWLARAVSTEILARRAAPRPIPVPAQEGVSA
ncbi:MATE family efflux transporter [Plantactinospora sp. B24E8]|uniref:MATE family efflux transporter n=1 Tax=Plantactinospora sp. B24E8 TaxID=3153567 RepID=UPI00325F02DE